MERLLYTLYPGTQFAVNFSLAGGRVRLCYPLEGDPYMTITTGQPGDAVRLISFERNAEILALMEGAEGTEGAGR